MTISRRDFLKASGLAAAWTALAACTPATQTAPSPTQTAISLPIPTQIPIFSGSYTSCHSLANARS